ncbi:MAG TPA: DinB family protein [Rubricoccaceae bacterium]
MFVPPEPWLRGPVAGVAPVFQPIAHALQHAVEDIGAALTAFPDASLEARPAGVASVGFHLRHIVGVLDRMATYARGEALSPEQFAALAVEGADGPESTADLVAAVRRAAERFTDALRQTPTETAFDARTVGRKALPSTVLGLLVHAAEHTQRHAGQLIVTARVVMAGDMA